MSNHILPNRHSIRLQNYNYSQPGVYFITVCTHDRKCLFGNIRDGKMITNPAGKAVQEIWDGLPIRFPSMALDSLIVMPNHVHAILALFRMPRKRTGAASSAPTSNPASLGKIVRAFKSFSAIEVNRRSGLSAEPVWQRNYFEHVVRRGEDLGAIRQYIFENPACWGTDRNNPNVKSRVDSSAEIVTPPWHE